MQHPNYSELTYAQMAQIVGYIREEVNQRNPLWCNLYTDVIGNAQMALTELHNKKVAQPGYDEADERE